MIVRVSRYNNKDNLSAAMIVGGVDKSGPHLYSIPLGGSQVKVKVPPRQSAQRT